MSEFDSVGVVLTQLRNGKFRADRIGIRDGKVFVLAEITQDRQMNWAHRAAAENMENLVTDISRGRVKLTQPEPIDIKVDE